MNDTKNVDPSALGLFGLGITALVSASEKLGITSGYSYLLPWIFFLGCVAQIIAGIYEFKRGSIFGGTAFLAYGLFWAATTVTLLINTRAFGDNLFMHIDNKEVGFAFIGYLIFTLYMTIGAIETNKVQIAIFLCLCVIYFTLVLNSFNVFAKEMQFLAGLAGMLLAGLSFYASAASIFFIQFGRDVLPLGKPLGLIKTRN